MTNDIHQKLFAMADSQYKQFQCGLIPDVPKELVIGVRTPILRKLAKSLTKEQARAFMEQLPHQYYEENNLHAFMIEAIDDFDSCIDALERFLPHIDNWATCDSLRPKCFLAHRTGLLDRVRKWIYSEHTFTVRYAIEMLMVHYLDEDFSVEYAELVASVDNEAYYVRMMVAWYFATALTKQWDRVIYIIKEKKLTAWVHNKTIQKVMESRCFTPEQKMLLKSFKV